MRRAAVTNFAIGAALVLSSCSRANGRAELRGIVTTASGAPVAGALVAANRPGEGLGRFVATKDDGTFVISLERSSPFALTATSDKGTAAHRLPESFAASRSWVTLTLGDDAQGFLVEGRVLAAGPLPAEVTVSAGSGNGGGDEYVARVDGGGHYRLRLPRAARTYILRPRADGFDGVPLSMRDVHDQVADLHLHVPAPLPEAVTAWVQKVAIPLKTVEPAQGFDDLAPVGQLVDGARIVGLGEATHGSREFFQLKHRLLEYLVTHKGFRGIAIEAGGPEARRLNEYVLHGRGSVAEGLAGLRYWTWDTEEVRAMIDWMHAFNAEPGHAKKVELFGVDMEFTALAAANVRAFLNRLDPDFARAHAADLAFFADRRVDEHWLKHSREQRESYRIAADAIVTRLDEARAANAKAGRRDDEDLRTARSDARTIAQWTEVHARDAKHGDFDFSLRDIAMMENLDAVLADGVPDDKLVFWAHNGHVGVDLPTLTSTGELLRKKHGPKYIGIGLLFGHGGFQARGAPSSPHGTAVRDFDLGPPPESDVTTPLSRTGHRVAMLDLRHLPEGVVRDWFGSPHPVRDIGTHFGDETGATAVQILSRRYDAVAFVAKTTPSRPNAPHPPDP